MRAANHALPKVRAKLLQLNIGMSATVHFQFSTTYRVCIHSNLPDLHHLDFIHAQTFAPTAFYFFFRSGQAEGDFHPYAVGAGLAHRFLNQRINQVAGFIACQVLAPFVSHGNREMPAAAVYSQLIEQESFFCDEIIVRRLHGRLHDGLCTGHRKHQANQNHCILCHFSHLSYCMPLKTGVLVQGLVQNYQNEEKIDEDR